MEVTTASDTGYKPRALDAQTVAEAFQLTAEDRPDQPAIRTKGDEFVMTWGEYAQRARDIAAGLAGVGIGRGDTVAIMLTNRPEFHPVDSAAMHLGATPFSIYNTYTPDQITYLVNDAATKVLVTEQAFLDTVLKAKEKADALEHVVVIDGDAPEGGMTLDDLIGSAQDGFDFDAAWKAVDPDDILTLIYTSGTTGDPKGVQLTHRNLLTAVKGYHGIIDFPEEGSVVSWLPMAHIAERACSHYIPILLGFTATCCPDPRQVVGYLPEVRPTWFFAVPRIWEKLKAGLEAMIEGEQDAEKKAGMQKAMEVGLKRVDLIQSGQEVPAELEQQWQKFDELVYSKIRAQLGLDRVESLNVGAAPTPPEVIRFYHAIGLPLAELWGMSETTGYGTCNRPDNIKIGTVGPPSPGAEIKLAEDGEILIKGPFIMPGYRNNEEKTRETIDDDGWLHTGDVGEFDDDGFLKIVDRKKELIINAAGKNMSPANIESKLKAAGPLIGQAIAVGDSKPYNVALLTLDPDSAPPFAQANGIEDASVESLAADEKVLEAVGKEVEAANEQMARVEQIKKWTLLPVEWEPGGEELTPTMKLKRKPIAAKYKDEIEALYSG
ncbi:MAG TPA: long-chain fatty acid--CoA ligase [Thermoleophilaceae bacterium]|nr:long-chain fatty acid--CoA ligase [Thermoleophilaceae bacterium]